MLPLTGLGAESNCSIAEMGEYRPREGQRQAQGHTASPSSFYPPSTPMSSPDSRQPGGWAGCYKPTSRFTVQKLDRGRGK